MLIAIMHCVPDEDDPYGIVRTLIDAVSSGSYLALSQPAKDMLPEKSAKAEAMLSRAMRQKVQYRTHAEVSRFFDGLDLLEPGMVHLPEWRPASGASREPCLDGFHEPRPLPRAVPSGSAGQAGRGGPG
jgi:hypothetical protein